MIRKKATAATAVLIIASLSACLTAAEVKLTFDHFYDGPAVVEAIKSLHRAHPGLTELKVLGKSEEGRDIWLLTINNKKTGKDIGKPAVYVDGAIHGNEIQATEVCLYLTHYLLSNYSSNPVVKDLVVTRTFYIVPIVNVDNRARFFTDPGHYHRGRSARVPYDDDRDGLKDEDDYDDLDKDGEILQMRVKDKFGGWKTHPKDKRVMIRVEPGEEGEWRLLGMEGIDNDADGRLNEDTPGYLDMNRNYGYKWQPPYVQDGAGDFPLSANPTRAVADFVVAKPNIIFTVAFHNYVGAIYRGPGSKLAGTYPPNDSKVYDDIGREGEKIIPGYKYLATFKDMYTTHGDFDEFMYSGLGVFGFTGELFMPSQESFSKPAAQPGKKKSIFESRVKDDEKQKFSDFVTQGAMFRDWKPFDHPQFGKIEIGGWRTFTTRLPQPFQLPELVHRNASLVIFLAKHAPEIELEVLEKKRLAKDLTRIRIRLANNHAIPTLSDLALRHNLFRKDIVKLGGKNLKVVSGGIVEDLQLDKVNPVEHRPQMIFTSVPSFGKRDVQFIVKGRGQAEIIFNSVKARNKSIRINL
jgi:hypothetical protein